MSKKSMKKLVYETYQEVGLCSEDRKFINKSLGYTSSKIYDGVFNYQPLNFKVLNK